MDKNAIKKFAVWARRELIERVSQRAMIYGITAKDTGDPYAESINGHLLSQKEKKQRQALIRNINEKGYEQVMEEVAYTWFNRFAALRFMEVNGYLPSYIRVFTNDAGEFKPQILAEAIHLELDGLDMNKVYEMESANETEELYKYLLIVQCNALNSILPGMFQPIGDYTELLFPDFLLREGSVIEQMIITIPEEDWTDQVQIIGWLYQYYNTEPKDKVFADLKKNIKITKENIPAATQLFTPDWIVHYMVENSLGRLWLEGHPNDALKSEWKYYLDEAEQEPDVQAQLEEIRKEYAALKPEEIRVIDPCMGSGHILCVLFDVLVRIYEDYGYTAREATAKIVENNLWGLDIDERAAQLSYFAVMMKARQYDRRFFARKVQPHVYAIEESNGITSTPMHEMGLHLTQEEYAEAVKQAMRLVEEMHDAKEYGSIIHVTPCDWNLLRRFAVPRDEDGQLRLDIHGEIEATAKLHQVINIGETLAQKYNVVVTNPPYMGGGGMSAKLSSYVKKHFPDSKSDLFAVFIDQCRYMTKRYYFQAMITQHVWMFLSSFEKLRAKLQRNIIVNMAHLGARAFEEIGGEVVQTTSFVFRNVQMSNYKGTYCRLIEANTQQAKEELFLSGRNRYVAQQTNYIKIPGSPVAYWLSDQFTAPYSGTTLGDIGFARSGLQTGNNNLFLRLWFEVSFSSIAFGMSSKEEYLKTHKKWTPQIKGGDYRKWYGNLDYIVNWENDGALIRACAGCRLNAMANDELFFRPGVTWSHTSSFFGARMLERGALFNVEAPTFFCDYENMYYVLGMLNSCVAQAYLTALNSGMHYLVGNIVTVPIIIDETNKKRINCLVEDNIANAISDWDAFENSWSFSRHPLIPTDKKPLSACYEEWAEKCDKRFAQVKSNEEELNRLFINIYGLANEMSPYVDNSEITIRKADAKRDIRNLISFAIGCMFGRYSLDAPGIVYAGGEWDSSKYVTFQPDRDGILPICDDEYFEDDIVGRFIDFVRVVYGEETLEENLNFIAKAIGGKGSSREVIRYYFINEYYADHCATYSVTGAGHRPIYWLFDSGKKNGFKCLIYMHRYRPDTIARIRTDYVHEQQSRYRTAIADLENQISSASTSDRVKLTKRLQTLQAQAEETRVYEEKIHHLADQMIKIDLDDGVKVNYAKFQDVLAKIK